MPDLWSENAVRLVHPQINSPIVKKNPTPFSHPSQKHSCTSLSMNLSDWIPNVDPTLVELNTYLTNTP